MRRPREVERKGIVYSPTLVQIPMELKRRAKIAGVNISATCIEALEQKLRDIELMTNHEPEPIAPSETKA